MMSDPTCNATKLNGAPCTRKRLDADGRCYQHPLDGMRKDTRKDTAHALHAEKMALQLRAAGYTFREIGEHIGLSEGGANAAYRRALRHSQHDLHEQARQHLELELERLDIMQKPLWTKALKGDRLATETVLKIMKHRANLLGLTSRDNTKIKINIANVETIQAAVQAVVQTASLEEIVASLRALKGS